MTRDCRVPGCVLEALGGSDRCTEHRREQLQLAVLMRQHAPLVKTICASYTPPPGMDEDDVVQIGMLALWEAVQRYKLRRRVPFHRFLALVIANRFKDAGVKAHRQKNLAVSESIRVLSTEDGGELDIFEVIPDRMNEPSHMAEVHEDLSNVIHGMNVVLTESERLAIQGVLNDRPYDEIAEQLHGDRRTVDNAVQRARRKLRASLGAVAA